jgi:hypothetical protein
VVTKRGCIERGVLKESAEKTELQSHHSHILVRELYVTSGHYAKIRTDSFQPISTPQLRDKTNELYLICEIYNVRPWSYKDSLNVMLSLVLFTDTNKVGIAWF